jgi:hypothetical protein
MAQGVRPPVAARGVAARRARIDQIHAVNLPAETTQKKLIDLISSRWIVERNHWRLKQGL